MLSFLGLRDGSFVLLLLSLPVGCGLLHSRAQVGNGSREIADLGIKLADGGFQLLDFRGHLVQTLALGIAGLLVGAQLGVAPTFVLSLLLSLLLQLAHHVTDHLLHIAEDIVLHPTSKLGQRLTSEPSAFSGQERSHAGLLRVLHIAAKLQEAGGHEAILLVPSSGAIHSHLWAGQDLDCLLDSLQLALPKRLALRKVTVLLLTLRSQLGVVILILFQHSFSVAQLTSGSRFALRL
mmetsp:Transcript_10464/g.23009  ORF Transcript_10464/g.23009 Transcript_10464/m.23009 type:complete len:236 (-) Transcript_10464:849-1556(-)